MPKYSQGSPNRYPNQSFVAVMTDAQRDASKAAIGSMVYSSTDDHLYVYNGTEWKDVTTPS